MVVEVADGKTTKKSKGCASPLEWGAVRIKWPEDTEFEEAERYTWTVLKPDDFNQEVHLGWRYSADELRRLGPPAKRRA